MVRTKQSAMYRCVASPVSLWVRPFDACVRSALSLVLAASPESAEFYNSSHRCRTQ